MNDDGIALFSDYSSGRPPGLYPGNPCHCAMLFGSDRDIDIRTLRNGTKFSGKNSCAVGIHRLKIHPDIDEHGTRLAEVPLRSRCLSTEICWLVVQVQPSPPVFPLKRFASIGLTVRVKYAFAPSRVQLFCTSVLCRHCCKILGLPVRIDRTEMAARECLQFILRLGSPR